MAGKIMTERDIPKAFWEILKAMGLPEATKELTLKIVANDTVEITCTFYAVTPDGLPKVTDGSYELFTRKYQIVEKEEEDAA